MQNNFFCNDCATSYKDFDDFTNHKNNDLVCIKYKDILFYCLKCNYRTKGIYNIDNHICSMIYDLSLLTSQIENKIYKDIIENNLNISLSNKNPETVIKKVDINIQKPIIKKAKKLTIKKRISNNSDFSNKGKAAHSDASEESECDISNIEDIIKNINKNILNVKENRKYASFLKKIKIRQRLLFHKISINEYIKILDDNVKQIEIAIKDKNNWDLKRIQSFISEKMLSPLDIKLLYYSKYEDIIVDGNDIENLNINLSNGTKELTKYNFNTLCDRICNYSIAIYSIPYLFEKFITKDNNVIYVNLKNLDKNPDPFSFYTLNNLDNDKREWKMDCRLDNLCNDLIRTLQPFAIDLFRKIYTTIYHDNIYRKDFSKLYGVLKQEGTQLIKNIIILHNPIYLSNLLRPIIVKNSTHIKQPNDIFKLSSDDINLKNKFKSYKVDNNNIIEILILLFDDPSKEDIEDILNNIELKLLDLA